MTTQERVQAIIREHFMNVNLKMDVINRITNAMESASGEEKFFPTVYLIDF